MSKSDVLLTLEQIRNHIIDRNHGGQIIRVPPNGLEPDDITPELILELVEELHKPKSKSKKLIDWQLSRKNGFDVAALRRGSIRLTQS